MRLHLGLETLIFHLRTASRGENTGRKRFSAQNSQGTYVRIRMTSICNGYGYGDSTKSDIYIYILNSPTHTMI
jgi:hypothetical protein